MKKLLFFLSITLGICFAFFINHSSSYAMGSSMALDYALWNAYNIGAEYACSRTARNLENPIYSDVVNISGINDPFSSSQQYGQVLWNANGRSGSISQTEIWNAIQQDIQDFDVSSMTSEELSDFLDRCGVILDDVGTNWAIKTSQLNGIRFYWATTKAGDWLGTSFKNILAKFETPSVELQSSIQSESAVLYPFNNGSLMAQSISFVYATAGNDVYSVRYNFNFPCFFYSEYAGSSKYYVNVCLPSSFSFNNVGNYYRFTNGNQSASGTLFLSSISSNIFTVNGVEYKTYQIISTNVRDQTSLFIGSLNDVKNILSQYGYEAVTINSELVDSQSVPYTVPEIGELATPITDIYPILESIRNGIISIPTTGELATVLYPSLADAIADAITDAKASSITIADTQDPSPPNPDDDEDEFTPVIGWVGDLMPDGMFTMFEPIFSIVPSNYSMYGFWISIPLIIIVCIIIYFIVSVL